MMLNMPVGSTLLSQKIYHLHMLSFWVSVGICTVVFFSIIILLFKFRKSAHVQSRRVKQSRALEITWIVVPFLLLIIMGVPATTILMHADRDETPELNIKITGYQWKWQYEYMGQDVAFFSQLSTPWKQMFGNARKEKWYLREVDQPLVLPTHTKIRFLVTSHDVIHSWWAPELGIKRDAIPGFIYESKAWIKHPGIYRGQCAELCGINHGFMPIVVEAKSPKEFAKWLQEKKLPTHEDLDGKTLYLKNCSACHLPDGTGRPPFVPALQGGKGTIGPLEYQIQIVFNGIAKSAMPAFKNQLTNAEIAAIINYERNTWGNDNKLKYGDQAGGSITAEDIKKISGGE